MLNDKHRAELSASGISNELIEASGIRSVNSRETHDILKWSAGPGSRDMSAYLVWSHTKYADLANYIPDHVEALVEEVIDSLDHTANEQRLLQSFFRHAGLTL